MSERWVIKYDARTYYSPCGLSVGEQLNAEVFLSRPTAARVAKRIGGRVVKLVAKRSSLTLAQSRQATKMASRFAESQRERAEKAEAEVEGLKDEVARAYSTADEVWLRAMARSDHARRWKALAKRMRRERDAFRSNLDAMLEDYDKLRGPSPSDDEIWEATEAGVCSECSLRMQAEDCHTTTPPQRRNCVPADLPLRRREVGDEELGEIAYRAYLAANCVWAAAGRAAIALATRPAVPPTDGELAETYVFDVEIDESGRTQHVERLRAVWSLGGRSTITLEEFDAAAKAYWDSNPGRDGLRAALRSLGIEVES